MESPVSHFPLGGTHSEKAHNHDDCLHMLVFFFIISSHSNQKGRSLSGNRWHNGGLWQMKQTAFSTSYGLHQFVLLTPIPHWWGFASSTVTPGKNMCSKRPCFWCPCSRRSSQSTWRRVQQACQMAPQPKSGDAVEGGLWLSCSANCTVLSANWVTHCSTTVSQRCGVRDVVPHS